MLPIQHPQASEGTSVDTFLTVLPLLACPLMMLVCMRGMFGGKKCDDKTAAVSSEQLGALSDEQVRVRLAAVQREELALRERLVADGNGRVNQASPPSPRKLHRGR